MVGTVPLSKIRIETSSSDSRMLWQANPFSARSIRPGTIEYLFPVEQRVAQLIAKLRAAAWRGQIVGPHGSGKSTLLAALCEPLELAGRRAWMCSLHDRQRRLPLGWIADTLHRRANMIIVDGYEQLGRLSRWELKLQCRWRRWGLLVTAHRDVGLPTLFRTVGSLEVAQAVVERLLPAGDAAISRQMVAEHFAAAGGNVRETLFSLYDEYARHHTGRNM
jgi:hypothetical protein